MPIILFGGDKMLNEHPTDLFYVYLAGIMLGGESQKHTIKWRHKIRSHYENWKSKGIYEISFLDPWNGEINAEIDNEGITNSQVNSKTIYLGDKMAIKKADLIIANFNQFESKRPSVGTFFECGMALAWDKPLILIVPKNELEKWNKHPFTSQAVQIFTSVDDLLDSKILNWFYKRVNSANYEFKNDKKKATFIGQS